MATPAQWLEGARPRTLPAAIESPVRNIFLLTASISGFTVAAGHTSEGVA